MLTPGRGVGFPYFPQDSPTNWRNYRPKPDDLCQFQSGVSQFPALTILPIFAHYDHC
jgi:hypothetical protein